MSYWLVIKNKKNFCIMYLIILMNIEIFWKYFGLSINGIFLVFFVESSSLQLVAYNYYKKWNKKDLKCHKFVSFDMISKLMRHCDLEVGKFWIDL